ncbi:hypothetical protein S2M10_00050 [Sphingomonas sp. S2M10]|uniref:hypothetical protein n=1 Tax=Sphingomonas sp. S2M10 TaxID=2705010 RepID=UPI0014578D99|nr:hypothetical protein [Sphingomonas sp. S2M10]NLS25042.1 hypothetical protein [Sphingomonas sp. S2M10]
MKPITKAMTLTCCALVGTTSVQAASDESAPLNVKGQRTIVPTMSGFVIRAAGSVPPTPSKIIRIGADMHLDARLFLRPALSTEESSHARR